MQKITPFLWFNTNVEEAIVFYTSIFKDSKIKTVSRYGKSGPGPEGSIMTAQLELNGQEFLALNGGPHFKFTEAISFVVSCKDQEEIDYFWEALSKNGEQSQCGWLKDQFGLSWQVVPSEMGTIMGGSNPEGRERAMQAMMHMTKLNVKELQDAYDGK